jgi:hypothetical protein
MQQYGKMIKVNGLDHFFVTVLLMFKDKKCLNLKVILLHSLMLSNNMELMRRDLHVHKLAILSMMPILLNKSPMPQFCNSQLFKCTSPKSSNNPKPTVQKTLKLPNSSNSTSSSKTN